MTSFKAQWGVVTPKPSFPRGYATGSYNRVQRLSATLFQGLLWQTWIKMV